MRPKVAVLCTEYTRYDAEGSTTRITERSTGSYRILTYDHRRRLTRVEGFNASGVAQWSVSFTYDTQNRLIAVRRSDGSARKVVYDREHPWLDFDQDDSPAGRYVFGNGFDELVARDRQTDGLSWYLIDKLGTVRDIASADGVPVNRIHYSAFGAITAQSNPAAGDRFGFTGREYDPDARLYYYRARHYNPSLGRFISQDPLGLEAGDTNLYRYMRNSPVNGRDPLGLTAAVQTGVLLRVGPPAALLAGITRATVVQGVIATGVTGLIVLEVHSAPKGEQFGVTHSLNATFGLLAVLFNVMALNMEDTDEVVAKVEVETVRAEAKRRRPRKYWRCSVTCTKNEHGSAWNSGTALYGVGTAKTKAAACRAAKNDAMSRARPGVEGPLEEFFQCLIFGGTFAACQIVCPPGCDKCWVIYL